MKDIYDREARHNATMKLRTEAINARAAMEAQKTANVPEIYNVERKQQVSESEKRTIQRPHRRLHKGRFFTTVGVLAAVIALGGVIAKGHEGGKTTNESQYIRTSTLEKEIKQEFSEEDRKEFIAFTNAVQRLEEGVADKLEREEAERIVYKYAQSGKLKESAKKVLSKEITSLVEEDGGILRATVAYSMSEGKNPHPQIIVMGENWHGSQMGYSRVVIESMPDFMKEAVDYVVNGNPEKDTVESTKQTARALIDLMLAKQMIFNNEYYGIDVIESEKKYEEIMNKKRAKKIATLNGLDKSAYYAESIEEYKHTASVDIKRDSVELEK